MEFHVQRDPYLFGDLKLWLREQVADDRFVLHAHDGRRVDLSSGAAADPDAYFAIIPERAAHSLLAVLARELGAVEHPEQLRADYNHLRVRHDKLVDALLDRDAAHTREVPPALRGAMELLHIGKQR